MAPATTMQQILVVDDDKDIVRLVRAYLEKAGFQVLTAHEGETALHILRHDKPALLVLDLMLPDADGWRDFLQGWDDSLAADPQPLYRGTSRHATLDREAHRVRATLLRLLGEYGAITRVETLPPFEGVVTAVMVSAEPSMSESLTSTSMTLSIEFLAMPGVSATASGASFTALTVAVKLRLNVSTPPFAVPPLSVTVTVIVALPEALATGV